MTKSRHIINRKCTGHNWTRENAVTVISRYSDLKTFREENRGLYAAIQKNGWLELLTPLQRRFVWTKDAVKQIINKYNTFRQFKQENMAAYSAICRNNWTDLYNRFNDRPVNWTRELIEKNSVKIH